MAKAVTQRRTDEDRRHYTVNFPRDVEFDAALSFVRALGGLMTGRLARFGGLKTVVFEVESDVHGIKHHLSMPSHLADFVIGQLRGQLPGAHVELDEHVETNWTRAVELGMTSARPLRIGSADAVVATLLSSFMPLKEWKPGESEKLLMQWVVAPAFPERPDPKDKAQSAKQSDVTFLAVGRIAARAQHDADARRLLRRLFSGLASMRSYGVAIAPRRLPQSTVKNRIERRAGVVAFPCLLTAGELATVIAFPTGKPQVAGLPMGRARHLAADPNIPSKGFVIGMSNFPGAERPLAIDPVDYLKHFHCIGPTGTGKSTVAHNVIDQQMRAGYGLALLEPKGDLIADIINSIPKERIGDVILYDPTDTLNPIAFNILEGSDPYLKTDQILAIFDRLYNIYSMPRTSDILRHGILTLAMKRMTLLDLTRLLASGEQGKDFRHQVTRGLKDPALRHFWDQFDNMRPGEMGDATAPLLRRLRPFELRPSLRAALGQAKSGFSIKDVIEQKKILLVLLAKGQLGEETSSLFGALFVSKLWEEGQARSAISSADRHPFFLHLDEFQNYLALPVSVTDMLAEARGYGLGLSLYHQNLGQLPPNLREGVLANARSKVVFAPSAGDASSLAREFAPYLDSQDLINLGNHEVVVRLAAGGSVAAPATATTAPPPRPTGSARAVREASRAAYGRPLADIEAELAERYRTFRTQPNKPEVGWESES